MFKSPEVGSEEWIIAAEKAEWAFMEKMLNEADEALIKQFNYRMSGIRVAADIARERSKAGWRTYQPPKSVIPGIDTKIDPTP